ncbi:hypothetical protein PENSPDRAFT_278247 [Peniophora sp. CONT]|nr:hypothetical protein PENSPDRAFT_278247 [Peniophora sp. CONT]
MCGICVSVSWGQNVEEAKAAECSHQYETLKTELQHANSARGPDAQRSHVEKLSGTADRDFLLECYSSELWLRGDSPIVQPHVHPETGNVLCWNGEIFDGLNISVHENDGARMSAALSSLSSSEQLVQLFGALEGPYAFAFYHRASRRLFFARDPLGRRSLLLHTPTRERPWFFLASASAGARGGYELAEVDTGCFYMLDLGTLAESEDPISQFPRFLRELPRSVHAEGSQTPRFAIPTRVNGTPPPTEHAEPTVRGVVEIPDHLAASVDELSSHLDRSVRLRVENIPEPVNAGRARVAVLFSGGIDSTVCAFLAHRHVPLDEPIDLLNVAFENPRKLQARKPGRKGRPAPVEVNGQIDYMVPDRETGLQEVEELRRICPGRTWNFVEVNVPYAEYQASRSAVEAIIWPRNTVMDLSLAMALYFAARGVGQVKDSPSETPRPYHSTARVLLNGLGSDELLGGYGRHRTAYIQQSGWPSVIEELQLDLDRIPTRNMGRDDRIISSHGKEARHPFLSLDVVNFLASLPVHHKIDPRLEVGLGDKLLLRLAAYKMGLVEASTRKKRAMQFGSHSARMEAGTPRHGGTAVLE